MNKILLCILLISSSILMAQETNTVNLSHEGLDRSYILYVPASYTGDEAVPLVFNFHGYTSNAEQQLFYGDFRPIAEEEGFIVVHPQGTVDGVGAQHFNVGWGGSTVDDVSFTGAMIDDISASYNINQKRIYSTGMSNGGFMSYELACKLSDRIAAIASVTGSMSPFTFNNCNANRPVPVLEIHGTADGTVPYTGGSVALAIPDVIDYWVDQNKCGEPNINMIDNPTIDDVQYVEHFVYPNGDEGVNVELMRVVGGTHTWPGTLLDLGGTNYDIDASAEVWKFFSKFDIDGAIESTSTEDLELFTMKVSPNPAIDQLQVTSETSGILQIRDIAGKLLLRENVPSGKSKVSLDGFSPGLYIVQKGNESHKLIIQQ